MTMPMYASAEQIMRDKTEYARKGIARGRSVVVMTYGAGVLMVAENASSSLHKVGEIYDRIGFAAVGRYNEFENLRQAGIRYADTRGFSYDRRDVTARGLANAFAQTLGAIFSEQLKPFEVEVCVAEVGRSADDDELYRLTFDGSVVDEPSFIAMGGQADVVTSALKDDYQEGLDLAAAIGLCVRGLGAAGADNGTSRAIPAKNLEVAVLERDRPGRTFRRITGSALEQLVAQPAGASDSTTPDDGPDSAQSAGDDTPIDVGNDSDTDQASPDDK